MKANTLGVVLLLVTAFSQAAQAVPYTTGYPGHHYGRSPATDKVVSANPDAIVRDGIGKLQRFIKSGKAANHEQALSFMTTEIQPYFDFEYMTRWSAGPAWRRMSPQQRASVREQLQNDFMNTLASLLVRYTDQPIRYFTPRGQERDDVRVSAWIMQPNGVPTRLEFRFYKDQGEWKIFDVKADGNSAVVYYRKKFRDTFHTNSRAAR